MTESDKFQWRDRRVLVTGATGMVGSWLVSKLLQSGSHVVCFVADNDPQSELQRSGNISLTTVVNGRLERSTDIERAINNHDIQTVFHLGAQPLVEVAERRPVHTFESNIQGTWNLLEACRALGGVVEQIVIASSDKAYGPSDSLPYVESMPLGGRQIYEVSKSCTDLIAQAYATSFSLPVAIARCGNIFGGGDLNWSRIVPGTFRSILKKHQPILRSDGLSTRDYLHVDDVVKAYILLAEKIESLSLSGDAFNFSDENPLTVREIYDACCEVAGVYGLEPVVLGRAQGEIRHQYLDSTYARTKLGWKCDLSLRAGLTQTFSWYEMFFESRAKEELSDGGFSQFQ